MFSLHFKEYAACGLSIIEITTVLFSKYLKMERWWFNTKALFLTKLYSIAEKFQNYFYI